MPDVNGKEEAVALTTGVTVVDAPEYARGMYFQCAEDVQCSHDPAATPLDASNSFTYAAGVLHHVWLTGVSPGSTSKASSAQLAFSAAAAATMTVRYHG